MFSFSIIWDRHDIAEILLKVALKTINQSINYLGSSITDEDFSAIH